MLRASAILFNSLNTPRRVVQLCWGEERERERERENGTCRRDRIAGPVARPLLPLSRPQIAQMWRRCVSVCVCVYMCVCVCMYARKQIRGKERHTFSFFDLPLPASVLDALCAINLFFLLRRIC